MDETLPSWQDDDTCVRLARICEFDYVPEPLVVMHMHSGEQISTNPVKLAQGAYAFLNIHGDEIARHCGRRILAKRWVSAGEYVLRAGDHHKASQLFRKAIQVSALSLQALYYAPPALIFPPALLCMFVIKRAIIDYLRKIKKLAVSVI
jgi:hypothetical protein